MGCLYVLCKKKIVPSHSLFLGGLYVFFLLISSSAYIKAINTSYAITFPYFVVCFLLRQIFCCIIRDYFNICITEFVGILPLLLYLAES